MSRKFENFIENSDLEERKKNYLFESLARFSKEVDQARTRYDRALGIMVEVVGLVEKGTGALKPVTDFVTSVTKLIAEAKGMESAQLPAPESPKQITGPKREVEAPSIDDEK